MMSRWRFKAIKERQLFWTAFCMLSLLVSGDDEIHTHGTTTTQGTTTTTVNSTPTTIVAHVESSKMNSSTTTVSPASLETSTEAKKESNETSSPTVLTVLNSTLTTTMNVSSILNIQTHGFINGTTQNITTTTYSTASSEQTTETYYRDLTSTTHITDGTIMASITCMNIKDVTTKVICLELNETLTCEKFKMQQGKELGKVLCKKNSTCHIKLSESSVKRNCLLLVGLNSEGVDPLDTVLGEKIHYLPQLGIKKSHKPESVENHKDYSRKTLIALVTSGLLMAFLGLVGYHFMKRRSWTPRGERLGEDPYYTENGGHGNLAASVASHEQSDLQDKPNLNGGTRENGTGQTASKNGHSAKSHVVADTEL